MKTMMAAVAAAMWTTVATAAPQVVNVGQDQGPATKYAQVCMGNAVEGTDVVVWTSWGIGDAWYPVILGSGTEMLYRYSHTDVAADQKLKVYVSRYGSEVATQTEVVATVGDVAVDSCDGVKGYDVRADRASGALVVVER